MVEEKKEGRKEMEEKKEKSEEVGGKKLTDESESMETKDVEDVEEGGVEIAEDHDEVSYVHMNEDDSDPSEKLVVEKGSVEEAKDSRAKLELLRE